jgi:hypothetical protein
MANYAMLRPDRLAMIAAFGLCAASQAQAAASPQMMGNIGDANKASGLIRHYTLDGSKRTIDAVAAVPSGGIGDDVIRKVTVETAHDICADRRGAGWTLRVFLPGQSDPIATCRFH